MTTPRAAWLKSTEETAIDPSLPICDPHHHLWDYPEQLPESRVPMVFRETRHYLLKEFLDDASGGHNIVQTVFMECNSMYRQDGPPELRCVGETEFVQGIAAQSASGQYGNTLVAAGIVGAADLTLGSVVARVLEAHLAASPNRFRGIRYITTWHPRKGINSRLQAPGLLADSKFREGFACLQKYGLSFDTWLFHTQLGELTELSRAFPGTTIILNHIGGPIGIGPYAGKRDEAFQEWKKGMAALSTCPNVFMKLGGVGMPLTGFDWHERPNPPGAIELAQAMAPYFDWLIEQFGTDRCMFESNFPVDSMSYSYTVIWNAFKCFAKDATPTERAALFHDTAARVYRLALRAPLPSWPNPHEV